MRKRLMLMGSVLIFSGLIVSSLYNFSAEKYILKKIYGDTYAWKVSGYFEKKDRLSAGIIPNDGWGVLADTPMTHVGPGINGMNITIEIISPKNGRAVFNLTLIIPPNRDPTEFPPKVVAWNAYLISKTDEFIINEDTPPLCAIVNETGIYSVHVVDEEWLSEIKLPSKENPVGTSAPKEIKLAREVLTVFYPYRNPFVIIGGAVLMAIGTPAIVLSQRDKSRKRKTLKKNAYMKFRKTFTVTIITLIVLNYLPTFPQSEPKNIVSHFIVKNKAFFFTATENKFEGTIIQELINDASEGEIIYLKAGRYLVSNTIFVNKSIFLIGEDAENTIIDGCGINAPIFVVSAKNVMIKGLTILNASTTEPTGIAINIAKTSNIKISNCIIKECSEGIRLTDSQNCTISFNLISNVGVGIYMRNGTLNTIKVNTLKENGKGIWFSDEESRNNLIYANQFINNENHIELFSYNNTLYRDYPLGGNFWNDHLLHDHFSGPYQNKTGSDGICDNQYIYDKYPLVSEIKVFPLYLNGKTFYIDLISNATVGTLFFNSSQKSITFWIQATKGLSFCRISIPKPIIECENKSKWRVAIDGLPVNTRIFEGNNYTCIYFVINFTGVYCKVEVSGERSINLSPLQGDLNNDGMIDIQDLNELVQYYGGKKEDYNWNPYTDLGLKDGEVDVFDFATLIYLLSSRKEDIQPFSE